MLQFGDTAARETSDDAALVGQDKVADKPYYEAIVYLLADHPPKVETLPQRGFRRYFMATEMHP